MKYLILLMSSVFLTLQTSAQITASDSLTATGSAGGDAEFLVYPSIQTTSIQNVSWQVIKSTIPTTWDLSICDKVTCYAPTLTTVQTFSDTPGLSSNILKIGFTHNGVGGSGEVDVRVWLTANPAVADTIHAFAKIYSVGIADIDPNTFSAFPNPVKDKLFLKSNKIINQDLHVEIMNVLGKTYYDEDIKQFDNESFPTANLASGVYFATIKDMTGKVIVRKKFLKD